MTEGFEQGVEAANYVGAVRPRMVLALAAKLAVSTALVLGLLSAGAVALVGTGADTAEEPAAFARMEMGEKLALVARVKPSVVRVVARTCEGRTDGTAFAASGVLFTNRHVIEGADLAKVDNGDSLATVEVVGRMTTSDVAWLASPNGIASLDVRQSAPDAGEPVVVFGFQGRDRLVARDGLVQLVTEDGSAYGVEGGIALLDVGTAPGFSGGPVVGRDGTVVAMLQGFDETTGLSIAIPVDELPAHPLNVEADTNKDNKDFRSTCQ